MAKNANLFLKKESKNLSFDKPWSSKITALTSYPLSNKVSYADKVDEMPPRRPSPTRIAGNLKGLSRVQAINNGHLKHQLNTL